MANAAADAASLIFTLDLLVCWLVCFGWRGRQTQQRITDKEWMSGGRRAASGRTVLVRRTWFGSLVADFVGCGVLSNRVTASNASSAIAHIVPAWAMLWEGQSPDEWHGSP